MGFRILVRSQPTPLLDLFTTLLEDFPYTLLCPPSDELDWTDEAQLATYFEEKYPSIVINFPWLHESAPLEGELASLNALSRCCIDSDVPLLHLSSFRVFGDAYVEASYGEDILPEPKDEIGQGFLSLERVAIQVNAHMLIRLGWLLGGGYQDLLSVLMPRLLNGDSHYVSDHNVGAPVQQWFVIKVLIAMVQQILCGAENWGVFHIRSADTCSEAEFADNLVRLLSQELGREISTPEVAAKGDDRHAFPGGAQLDGSRCTDDFGIQLPSWRTGLKTLIHNYVDRD